MSTTVTVNEAVAGLPDASVAEHSTVVVPSANTKPEAGTQLTVTTGSTLSTTEAAYVTVAPVTPVASATMSAGTVITGSVVSTTVTVNEAVAGLPAESVAEQLTVVVPIANVEPEGGGQVTGTTPSTLSTAEAAAYVTAAPVAPVASTTMSAGTAITGGVVSGVVLSMTVTVLSFAFETAKSARPSPLKSPVTTSTGWPVSVFPTVKSCSPPKFPAPLPKRTATWLNAPQQFLHWIGTTISAFPSLSKSATATARESHPTSPMGELIAAPRPPEPLFRKVDAWPGSRPTATTSGLLSPLTSAIETSSVFGNPDGAVPA